VVFCKRDCKRTNREDNNSTGFFYSSNENSFYLVEGKEWEVISQFNNVVKTSFGVEKYSVVLFIEYKEIVYEENNRILIKCSNLKIWNFMSSVQ
jgi:hypothetical protein